MQPSPHLALVVGEPAGIGPEICARALASPDVRRLRLTVFGDRDQVLQNLHEIGSPLPTAHDLHWQHLPLSAPAVPGTLDVRNAGQVLRAVDLAAKGCLQRNFDGMVTGPVHKGLLNEAGHRFSGMTERLAELSDGCAVVMMLATPALRVALVTTHLPLAQVPAAITSERLLTVIGVLHRALRSRFGIAEPRIAVLGLNPHAGEGGHLGREEVEVIEPVLQQLRQQGMQLLGPLPADTAFLPTRLQGFDAVLAMYHDQGLPVLKYSGFEQAVNITLGLPFVRVAVDHGTALDLAGSGRADPSSLLQALRVASQLAGAVEPGCA